MADKGSREHYSKLSAGLRRFHADHAKHESWYLALCASRGCTPTPSDRRRKRNYAPVLAPEEPIGLVRNLPPIERAELSPAVIAPDTPRWFYGEPIGEIPAVPVEPILAPELQSHLWRAKTAARAAAEALLELATILEDMPV